ncbi:MAG: YHS domain-containing protein [Gammaproteobacteria bacterium]|nr:YHS domain-containing protein [Gammaproteobacteria bacterium]
MVHDPVCLMSIDPKQAVAMSVQDGRAYYFCSEICQHKFLSSPENYLNKVPAMRLTVGVMGSASDGHSDEIVDIAYQLGKVIAEKSFVLITGACHGLPYECARGVFEAAGMSIGISPALSLDEHVHEYDSPSDVYDVIIYTGSGLMGREVTNIRSSDMVVVIGGSSGTLGEFAIAYDEGKLIGVLEGSGGITEQLPQLVESFKKDTGAQLVYNADPVQLIEELEAVYSTHHFHHPSCFCEKA